MRWEHIISVLLEINYRCRRVQKVSTPGVRDDSQETVSRYNRTDVYMTSESVTVCRRLHRTPYGVSALRGAVDMGLTPNEEAICN